MDCDWVVRMEADGIGPGNNRRERRGVSLVCPQLSLTLCDPLDYSLPGSSGHGIFQARIREWAAISYSRVSLDRRLKWKDKLKGEWQSHPPIHSVIHSFIHPSIHTLIHSSLQVSNIDLDLLNPRTNWRPEWTDWEPGLWNEQIWWIPSFVTGVTLGQRPKLPCHSFDKICVSCQGFGEELNNIIDAEWTLLCP